MSSKSWEVHFLIMSVSGHLAHLVGIPLNV